MKQVNGRGFVTRIEQCYYVSRTVLCAGIEEVKVCGNCDRRWDITIQGSQSPQSVILHVMGQLTPNESESENVFGVYEKLLWTNFEMPSLPSVNGEYEHETIFGSLGISICTCLYKACKLISSSICWSVSFRFRLCEVWSEPIVQRTRHCLLAAGSLTRMTWKA